MTSIYALSPPESDAELTKWAGMYVRARLVRVTSDATVFNGDNAFATGTVYLRGGLADLPPETMLNTCVALDQRRLDYLSLFHLQPQFMNDAVIGTGCP